MSPSTQQSCLAFSPSGWEIHPEHSAGPCPLNLGVPPVTGAVTVKGWGAQRGGWGCLPVLARPVARSGLSRICFPPRAVLPPRSSGPSPAGAQNSGPRPSTGIFEAPQGVERGTGYCEKQEIEVGATERGASGGGGPDAHQVWGALDHPTALLRAVCKAKPQHRLTPGQRGSILGSSLTFRSSLFSFAGAWGAQINLFPDLRPCPG